MTRNIIKTIVRILAQLVVAGPVIVFAPYAFAFGISLIISLFTGEAFSFGASKFLFFGLGWIGIIGLYGSIFIPIKIIQKRRWLRGIIVSCIVCGFIADVAPFFDMGGSLDADWFIIWFFLGPLIVGAWNLARIYRAKPPQQPQPPPAAT